MKKSAWLGLIALAANPAFAAETQIRTDDVIVTANRIPQPRESVLADVSVITREDIELSGKSSLAELLQGQPGVEIETSGGAGQITNVHLRGTGSQSVVVLVDGMRIGSATAGTTALQQIPTEQIERIEIVRGAVSSLYGADAIGGVIQVFTRKAGAKPYLSAYAGYGSDNTRRASISLGGSYGQTRAALNVSSLDTDGISALDTHAGRDADDDGYRNLAVSGHLTQTLAEGHELGVQLYWSDGHVEFDGNNFPAHQDMWQQSIALTSKNQITRQWLSQIKLGESMDDVDSEGSFGVSALRTTQRQYTWQNDFTLPLGTLTLAYDRLEERVKGDTDFSKKKRGNTGWLASYLLDQGAHTMSVGLRRDDSSQFGLHTTGNVGYGYRISPVWRVSGNIGTAFRAPTFNDLYWPFQDFGFGFTYQGNPDLKPEKSRNKEVSLVFDEGHHRVSATAYHNKVRDLLVGSQGLAADFPVNVGSATIKGLTLAYEGWFGNYHMRASADVLSPKNDDTGNTLSRRARRHAAIWLGKTLGDLELAGEVIASGHRYNDAANAFRLGGYTLLNLNAIYRLNQDWSINARAENVFDRNYTLTTTASSWDPAAPDFNTPGSSLFVGLRYQPK